MGKKLKIPENIKENMEILRKHCAQCLWQICITHVHKYILNNFMPCLQKFSNNEPVRRQMHCKYKTDYYKALDRFGCYSSD